MTYIGDGSQTVFSFPFDYLRPTFIKIRVDGNDPLIYGVDYSVVNKQKQLEFLVAPPEDAVVLIYRETTTAALVSWQDASVLRSKDMTVFEVQLLHLAEETTDKVQDSGLALDTLDNMWDARFRILKNLNDPVAAGDALTLRYFESVQAGYIQAAQAEVDLANAQAVIASTKATEASNSATSAASSAVIASTKATEASNSATTANTKATEASNSATVATTQAGIASTKATEATTQATRAETEANRAAALTDGVLVPAPSLPPGIPFPWFTDVWPDGTIECRGQSISAYPELLAKYPSGFLPDLRGVVLRGLDRGRGLESEPARGVGSYQGDAIRNITGSISGIANFTSSATGAFAISGNNGNYTQQVAGSSGNLKSTFDAATVVPTATENRVKNVACYWLVYTSAIYYDTTVEGGNAVTLGGHSASYFTSMVEAITPKYAELCETQPSGTGSGTFTAGAWRTRTLNTKVKDTIGVMLVSNQFELPAGVYKITSDAPAQAVNRHKIRLQNITDNITVNIGQCGYTSASGYASTPAHLSCTITLSSSKKFEIQHMCESTAPGGFGVASAFAGVNEIYTTVFIEKVG
ncbi:hypothetical protein SPFL3102_03586 [Sporomusaceae bacterium FL31]|nr:hypothetical protein SPFL3101_00419 [Sporomusaceae bacterium FL31]GCE35735.1 hypothetical protein SPFL3102_03586 [Sporomusaceae bacterium]